MPADDPAAHAPRGPPARDRQLGRRERADAAVTDEQKLALRRELAQALRKLPEWEVGRAWRAKGGPLVQLADIDEHRTRAARLVHPGRLDLLRAGRAHQA